LRPIESRNRRSKWEASPNGVGDRVEVGAGRRGGQLAAALAAQHERRLRVGDRETDRCRRHREAEIDATAGGDPQRPVRHRCRADDVVPVEGEDTKRRAVEREALGRVVGIDEAEPHGCAPRRGAAPDDVAPGERRGAVEVV
jgi:hypothetical protein